MIKQMEQLGYEVIEKSEKKLFILKDGKETRIELSKRPIFVNASRCRTNAEAEKLVAEGKALKTNGEELYKEFYDLTDEGLIEFTLPYSLRTYKKFEEELKKLSFVEEKILFRDIKELEDYIQEAEKLNGKGPFRAFANTGNYRRFKIYSGIYAGKWCVSFMVFGVTVDDVGYGYMFFDEIPDEEIIAKTSRILEIMDLLSLHRVNEIMDDGAHFLDTSDNFYECLFNLRRTAVFKW